MTKLVTTADAGHVRTITLNRAEKKNALNLELAWGVIAAVEQAAADDDVWVVALTGSGDAFCAGLDLSGSEPYSPYTPQTAMLDDIGWVGQFLLTIRKKCDKPVVGGVNGVAVGAGLGLAMATDVRIVARSARLRYAARLTRALIQQVERVCHEGVDPRVAVKLLMGREMKPE